MTRYPALYKVEDLFRMGVERTNGTVINVQTKDRRWVAARPLHTLIRRSHSRWNLAMMVFTGRADAVVWDSQP